MGSGQASTPRSSVVELLRADISCQMGTGVCMAVRMTFEARDATAWTHGTTVFRLVELLLRERRDEQPQALELFRIQNPVEQFIIVVMVTNLPWDTSPRSGRVVR